MPKQDYHVVPRPDGWAVKKEGAERAASLHDTKQQALDAGKSLAKSAHVELVIHGKNNRIQNPNSYGNDPSPPKDRRH